MRARFFIAKRKPIELTRRRRGRRSDIERNDGELNGDYSSLNVPSVILVGGGLFQSADRGGVLRGCLRLTAVSRTLSIQSDRSGSAPPPIVAPDRSGNGPSSRLSLGAARARYSFLPIVSLSCLAHVYRVNAALFHPLNSGVPTAPGIESAKTALPYPRR